jgi:hypothetical protein
MCRLFRFVVFFSSSSFSRSFHARQIRHSQWQSGL